MGHTGEKDLAGNLKGGIQSVKNSEWKSEGAKKWFENCVDREMPIREKNWREKCWWEISDRELL